MTHPKALGVADWRVMVYGHRAPKVGNGVRVLLLLMADRMDARRCVSVPRSQLAAALRVSEREITYRVHAAVGAGLLDTVVAGRPGLTAVYQGLFPDEVIEHGEVVTPLHGEVVTPLGDPLHGAGNHTPKTPIYGDHGVPTICKHNPTAPAVFSTGDCQGELKAKGAAIGESGAGAEPAGPLTVDPGISPLVRFSSEAQVSSACTKLTGPKLCGDCGAAELSTPVQLEHGCCNRCFTIRLAARRAA